ncbi:MAG TPA: hypothetical protein VED41_13050 [Solirubrobacteraceae bacterium]|nr:hypothetical protein [Solirubrobacteraceae bacterium]
MADYAAVPVQPIAQALLTIDAAGNPQLTGQGFSSVVRASVNPGDFLLTLDEGTSVADVGSGGVVDQPGFGYSTGIVGPNGLDPRFVRVSITIRGGTTAPGLTDISDRTASITSVPGEGVTQIRVALATALDVPTDPMGAGVPNAHGSGMEIMIWNGNAGPDNAQAVLVGPLFQGAMQFP